MKQKETLFDLLFRDDTTEEQYSPLGIALLISLVIHLIFATVIKVKTTSPHEASPSSPAFVSCETEADGELKVTITNQSGINPLRFGFQEMLFDAEMPLPPLSTDLITSLAAIYPNSPEVNLAKLIDAPCELPPLPAYPLLLELDQTLQAVGLRDDGTSLFGQESRECTTLSPLLCSSPTSVKVAVTVSGTTGVISKYRIIEDKGDRRLLQIAELLLSHIRLNPCSKELLDGTIVMKFSCSGDIVRLLLKEEYRD